MSLITLDELARGLIIGTLGGAAGLCTLSFPGSALWLLPAGLAVGGCALTVPEIRTELRSAASHAALPAPLRRMLPTKDATPAATPAPQARPAAPTTPDLVQTLEESPHRLIIGHTRGGKTTLIHHIATAWAARGERVLVADPDAAPGLWPGCEVRGAGDDVDRIEELLTIVAAEVATRRAARAQGQRRFPPLHLVIDEAQDVVPVLPGALDLVEDVARRGGKLGVRLTLGVQDKQVGTLGLDGKSHLLRNFQTADVLKDRTGQRVAVLRDAVTGERVTYLIPPLTDPESLIRTPHAPIPNTQDAFLAALLAEGIPPHQDAGECLVTPIPGNRSNEGNGHSSVMVAGEPGTPVTVNVTQVTAAAGRGARADQSAYGQALIALYRAAGADGETFAKVYAQHKGTKEIVFTAWQAGKKESHHA